MEIKRPAGTQLSLRSVEYQRSIDLLVRGYIGRRKHSLPRHGRCLTKSLSSGLRTLLTVLFSWPGLAHPVSNSTAMQLYVGFTRKMPLLRRPLLVSDHTSFHSPFFTGPAT